VRVVSLVDLVIISEVAQKGRNAFSFYFELYYTGLIGYVILYYILMKGNGE
jgi:hypothetical protein